MYSAEADPSGASQSENSYPSGYPLFMLYCMKMNKQTRIYAKQVQIDLLALLDDDLFQVVHLWVKGEPPGPYQDVAEETLSALGYTLTVGEPGALSPGTLSGSEGEARMQWLAPAPQQLRERLTQMDVKLFVQHVLPLAFQSLHVTHPEWAEGATFNAHLANHLRSIGMKRRGMTKGSGTLQRSLPL